MGLRVICVSILSGVWKDCSGCIVLLRVEGLAVSGAVAVFTDEIFPLAIMYTVQNGGAPLDTRLGTSDVLNLLS